VLLLKSLSPAAWYEMQTCRLRNPVPLHCNAYYIHAF